MEPPPDVISELMGEMDVSCDAMGANDDWLANLDAAGDLGSSAGIDVRRTQSSPSFHTLHPLDARKKPETQPRPTWTAIRSNSSSVPLPIGDMSHFSYRAGDDFSSLESSQSLLAGSGTYPSGSFTDESALIHQQSNVHRSYHLGAHYGSAPVPNRDVPLSIPGVGGRWQWIPDSAEAPNPQRLGASLMSGRQQNTSVKGESVSIASGPLPLPVPLSDMDLEGDPLDDLDILDMVETLLPGAPGSHNVPSQQFVRPRTIGSCPLPTLLEDSVSCGNENSGGSSDDTLHGIAATASPSIDANETPFAVEMQRSYSANAPSSGRTHSGSKSSAENHGNSGARGVPIPGARVAPLKRSGSVGSRSLSSPLLASELLASSLPTSLSSDRPVRSAARRSLALATAALQNGSDSESEDASYGDRRAFTHSASGGSLRRSGSSGKMNCMGSSAGANKKKHNPWSLEETLALVEGVQMAGPGKWAEIKRLPVRSVSGVLEHRSPVDLKDKWRNLCRVARLPKAALKQRLSRAHSDVPLETMLQVKQLMEASGEGE